MSYGKLILGLVVGSAVGATLGILFAPDKGSVSRKKINKKSDDFTHLLEDKFSALTEGISKKFETMNEEADRFSRKLKQKTEELTH